MVKRTGECSQTVSQSQSKKGSQLVDWLVREEGYIFQVNGEGGHLEIVQGLFLGNRYLLTEYIGKRVREGV